MTLDTFDGFNATGERIAEQMAMEFYEFGAAHRDARRGWLLHGPQQWRIAEPGQCRLQRAVVHVRDRAASPAAGDERRRLQRL